MTTIIYRAHVRTIGPDVPIAEAVAVDGDRIVAVGTVDEVIGAVGPDHVMDDRFVGQVLVPGLIGAAAMGE